MTLTAISALVVAACCAVVGVVALAGDTTPPLEARLFGIAAYLAAGALLAIAVWEIAG